jgi:hypothetical protein
MLKRIIFALAVACALLGSTSAVSAQSGDLQLTLSKRMGLALGDQIQGTFELGVAGASDLTSVTYTIDGKEMATVTQPPFRYTFSTDSYAPGRHQFAATAKTSGGLTLQSTAIDAELLTASEGMQSFTRVLGPILGILAVVIVAMLALQLLPMGRTRRHYEQGGVRNYGAAGGAICPKCGRPFARSMFGLNLVTGKLERCPYCGKWSITRPASIESLRAAEQAEAHADTPTVRVTTPEELLRQQIEDSRLSK